MKRAMEKWKKVQQKEEAGGCKRAPCCHTEEVTPGNRILHSKTRKVKFDGTGIVSGELANGKKIMNHVRGNKNVGKVERTIGARSTHGSDRKTRAIAYHDGRRAGRMRRSNGRKDTGVWRGVVRGTRISDPVGANRGQRRTVLHG